MLNQISRITFRFSDLNYQSKPLLVILIILLLPVLIIYGSFLGRTPVHLNQDELGFALNAYSIAKAGFDENGRAFPLYFWHLGVMWSTPIIVYLTALFLKMLPISEVIIRLPSVLIGFLDIVLIGILAAKIFKNIRFGIIAAFLLATTPVHFIHSRLLLDNLYIVPFVLGWLLLLYLFLEKENPWFLAGSTFLLGLGFHSYHAAKIMMPIYLLLTFFVAWPNLKREPKLLALSVVAFILPIIPLIPWMFKYPDTLIDQVRYTQLYDTNLNPLLGFVTLLDPASLVKRFLVFIAYFSPYFLFFRGDESLIHSTWRTGVFLLSFAILLPSGIYNILKNKRDRFGTLIIIGFLTAPFAAALVGDHYRISRALVILPFATLLAVYGVQLLLSQRNNLSRIICYLLLIAIPFQFAYFLYDYFKDYRIRSYSWFRYNIPGALETMIRQDKKEQAQAIYLDSRIDFIDRYWRFFVLKYKGENLFTRTYYFDPKWVDLENLPGDSLILYYFNDIDGLKENIGPFKKVGNIVEPDGTGRFYLFRN